MIWYFVVLLVCVSAAENITLNSEGRLVIANLEHDTPEELVSDNFLDNATDFYIPQCHSKQYNFTFSASRTRETDSSIGNVIYGSIPRMTVINTNNNSSFNLYCTYTKYSNISAPIPGGCNLEFNFERDPNIHIWYDGFRLWVQFQYASAGNIDCDKTQGWNRLTYSIYVLHLEDGGGTTEKVFSTHLSTFVLPSDIKKSGTKLLDHRREEASKPALIVTSYPDQGMFIGIIVYDNVTGQEAAYVSKISYGCDVNKYTDGHPCQVQWYYYLIATVIAIMGLFVAFVGHRYFMCELFIMGFLSGLLCGFIGLLIAQVSVVGLLAGSAGIAVGVGIIWLLVWQGAGIVIISLLLTAANAGFLIASVVFFTPLVNVSIFKNTWELWIMYAVVIMLAVLAVIIRSKKVNVVLCSFLGSYATAAAISVYCNASLHHIIIEPIRRAAVKDYYNSIFTTPFGIADGILVGVWVVLTIAGSVVQFYTERGKPDFPVSPRKKRQSRRLNDELEERERLLNPQNAIATPTPPTNYGTVSEE